MNFGIFLAFLCCVSAAYGAACCYHACKYTHGHNGKFTCTGATGNYRNNVDPTKYWVCNGAGAAECASCPAEQLFSPTAKKCVCFDEYLWTPPCDPENDMITDASGCEACVVPGTAPGAGANCGCGGSGGSGGSATCGCKSS